MRQLAVLLCALGLTACLDPGKNITPPLGEDMASGDMAPDLAPDADMEPVECTTVGDCDALPNTRVGCMAGRCVYECEGGFKTPPDETLLADGCSCEVKPGACNGADDDCDGEVDESGEFDPSPCTAKTSGVCMGATRRCEGDTAAHKDACDAMDYSARDPRYREAQDEDWLCDEADNDCDGEVDEACCVPGTAGRDPKERMPILTTPMLLLDGVHQLGVNATGERIFSVSCAATAASRDHDAIAGVELNALGEPVGSLVKRAMPMGVLCAGSVSVVRDMDERNVIIVGDDSKLYTTKYHIDNSTLAQPTLLLTPTPPQTPANASLFIYTLASASIGDEHVVTWTETYTTPDQYVIRFMGCKFGNNANDCEASRRILREISAMAPPSQVPLIKLFPVALNDEFHIISQAGEEVPQRATFAANAMLPTTMTPLPNAPATRDLLGVTGAGDGLIFLMVGQQGTVASRYALDTQMMGPASLIAQSTVTANLHPTPTGALVAYGVNVSTVSKMFTQVINADGTLAPAPTLTIDLAQSDNTLGFYATSIVPTVRGLLLQWSYTTSDGKGALRTLPLNAQGYPICGI